MIRSSEIAWRFRQAIFLGLKKEAVKITRDLGAGTAGVLACLRSALP
jgi:hypothetical protein